MGTSSSGYRSQAVDTSIEADRFEFDLLRQRTNANRFQMMVSCNQSTRRLSLFGLRRLYGHLTTEAFALKVAEVFLGECVEGFKPKGNEMTWIQDSSNLAEVLHVIFESLAIPYYITGGFASSVYGDPRSTRDLDVVIAVSTADLDRVVATLEDQGFYVPGVEDVKQGRMRTLSITHQETISRADLMVQGESEFERLQLERRQPLGITGTVGIYFASPEDIILNKLRWGKGNQSEKQWRDVLGILKVQQNHLDRAYLSQWATQLGLLDDLKRALIEADLE